MSTQSSRRVLAPLVWGCVVAVDGSSCWDHVPACWTYPPTDGKNKMKTRQSLNPKFTFDTAFKVVDSIQDQKWIVDVGHDSTSLGFELANIALDEAIEHTPWAHTIDLSRKVLSVVGVDTKIGDESQPLQVDMTAMVQKLTLEIKGWVDQKLFQVSVNNLQGVYRTYTKYLRSVESFGDDYESIMINMPAIINPLYQAFQTNIRSDDYVEKFAFFMTGPFLSHITLHYSAAMVRFGAQARLYNSDPSQNPSLARTACSQLKTFEETLTEYGTWLTKYRESASRKRLDAIPTLPDCHRNCNRDVIPSGSPFVASTVHEKYDVSYSWKDNWPQSQMQLHSEGFKYDDMNSVYHHERKREGTYTNGMDLTKEGYAYLDEAKYQVSKYFGDDMQKSFDKMMQTTHMLTSDSYLFCGKLQTSEGATMV